MRALAMALALAGMAAVGAANEPAAAGAIDWRTPAEASEYTATPRLAETLAYFERLAEESTQVRMVQIGVSAQGRPLHLLVVASDGEFTPEKARASGKDVLLIQAAIHPGENEGKDTLMALLRDIVVHGAYRRELRKLVLLLLPVFNVDGHERFSPYNRVNQNGPEAMGWRATAQNLNLNRDFMKADAPEMQAWLGAWNAWRPDLLVDMHNTNGADYQYPMTWAWEGAPMVHPALDRWQRETFEGRVRKALEGQGYPVFPYVTLVDGRDPAKGLLYGASQPRFSTGYAAIAGRAGLLLETHMLKDFQTRVEVNRALLGALLEALAQRPGSLRRAVRKAESEPLAGKPVGVRFDLAEEVREVEFLGYAWRSTPSEVSGSDWIHYEPGKPRTLSLPMRDRVVIGAEVRAPAAYLVPAQWQEVIRRLQLHGIESWPLERARELRGQTYRFTAVEWAARPFEGRHLLTRLEMREVEETLEFPAGSLVVPLDQPRARIAIHLLEPEAPDALIRWGFFDSIFEEKEYAEPRVMEAIARNMLDADPSLREEFAERLQDPAFAADPRARLRFFYERSPWFDQALNRYPVWRLDETGLRALRKQR